MKKESGEINTTKNIISRVEKGALMTQPPTRFPLISYRFLAKADIAFFWSLVKDPSLLLSLSATFKLGVQTLLQRSIELNLSYN